MTRTPKPKSDGEPAAPLERLSLASFGRRLRELRLALNLSPSDLARAVWGETTDARGYTVARNRDRISAYENGRAWPSEGNLHGLAKALNVPVEQLAPDIIAKQIDKSSHAALSITMVEGRPDRVRLVINTLTGLGTASEVIRLLSKDPLTAAVAG